MDLTSLLGLLTSADSIGGMSQSTNVSNAGVQNVLAAALPSLLSGAVGQSNNASTASSFANALTQHAAANTSDLSSFFGSVDTDDGAKIVQHLLGSNATSTINSIAKQTGVSKKDVTKVLSAAAPLLMSLIGQQANATAQQQQQQTSSANVANLMGSLMGNANVTSLLGSMLGAQQPQQQSSGGLLSGLLGLLK